MYHAKDTEPDAASLPFELRKYYELLIAQLRTDRPNATPVAYRGLCGSIHKNLDHCSQYAMDPVPFIRGLFPGGVPDTAFWNSLSLATLGMHYHQAWLNEHLVAVRALQLPEMVFALLEQRCHDLLLYGRITYGDAAELIKRFCHAYRHNPDWRTMDERCQIGRILLDNNDSPASWQDAVAIIAQLAQSAQN